MNIRNNPACIVGKRKTVFSRICPGLSILALGAALLALPACKKKDQQDEQVTLRVWHMWQAEIAEKLMKEIPKRYEATHPNVKIVFEQITGGAAQLSQKLLVAVAGGKPPDISFIDGSIVAEWAHRDGLMPLDDLVKQAGIKREDFFEPSWNFCSYNGKIWVLPFSTNPNFALFWNKKMFREAGLDPDRPPQTMKELDEYAAKLSRRDSKGNITHLGIIPWNVHGSFNSLYTWSWVFGGETYDPKSGKITLNHPKVVKALEWMTSYAKKYGRNNLVSETSGRADKGFDPFQMGRVAMEVRHDREIRILEKFAPQIEYGIAPLPYVPGEDKNSGWVGGWCLGLPKGSPHPKEAFEFLSWLCATREGSEAIYQATDFLPGYRQSPALDQLKDDPKLKVFIKILKTAKHTRPIIPVSTYMQSMMDNAVEWSLVGEKEPKQALDEATRNVQSELDKLVRK